MKKTLHFTYQSPENLVRLLCGIHYEKTHNSREIAIYHERFTNEPNSLYLDFMTTLYPNGITIDVKQIEELCEYIDVFLSKDEQAKDIKAKYDMAEYESYVYFDIDKKVYPCKYGSHQKIVKDICVDYFKGFDKDELSAEKISDFIIKHFKIESRFSTVNTIARDSKYILDCIIFDT